MLVPSGPAYPGIDIANQVCSVQGAQTGSRIVVGADYLQATFGYTWDNAWRNLGIMYVVHSSALAIADRVPLLSFGYLVFFLGVNLATTEVQRDESATGGVMIFKRGAAPKELEQVIAGGAGDEEKGQVAPARIEGGAAEREKEAAANGLEAASDIFTWRDVCYDVQIKGETRRLLDNVAGYVAPGQMTALMGESGAGKTTLLNVLAQRVTTGIVTGDMLVNGKPLPVSFQRQTGYCTSLTIAPCTNIS